ncbi:MAG: DUF885 family protein [Anaerorhabdus sp.]
MKKILILILSAFLLIGCSTSKKNTDENTDKTTDTAGTKEANDAMVKFMDEEFANLMASDFTNYHFTLKDASKYGIEKPEVSWGEFNIEVFEEYEKELEASLSALDEIDYDNLSKKNQNNYDIIKRSYLDTIELNKYPYNPFYFSAYTGVQQDILTVLTEWKFYDEEDVEDYLVLIEDLPRYFNEIIEFSKIQIEKGYWMPKEIIQLSLDSIEKFTSKVEDNALIVIFNKKIEELNLNNQEDYKSRNNEIVINKVLNSYTDVYKFLEENKDVYKGTGQTATQISGKEYYEALLKEKTSSNYTPNETLEFLTEYYEGLITELISVYSVFEEYSQYDEEHPDPNEVLSTLEEKLLKDYPQGPKVNYEISYLDKSIANDSIVAYYLIPPVDDVSDNVIRLNADNSSTYINFINTLAHEGFPGHLYQRTYSTTQDVHPLMLQQSFIGFSEGWAMMAGESGIRYFSDTYPNEEFTDVAILENKLSYIQSAIFDIAINYQSQTLEEFAASIGLGVEEVKDIYYQTIANQGQILPYAVGYMTFDLMEKETAETLKDKFDIVDYHKMILDGGIRPFEFVQKDVDEYVEENN